MKRLLWIALALAALLLSGCSAQTEADDSPKAPQGVAEAAAETSAVDVDLTQMSGTMVYSYVYGMMSEPDEYLGKRFKISGVYDESYWEQTDTTYHYIVISDATACCAQGLEFILADAGAVYPEVGAIAVLSGVFEAYDESGITFYHIVADEMQAG